MPATYESPLLTLDDIRFEHPLSMLISGTTGSGKSEFVKNLIEYEGIKGDIKTIYYFMPRAEHLDIKLPAHQTLFTMVGLPTQNWIDKTFSADNNKRDTLIVVDDQWSKCLESQTIEELLTYGRRHLGISMIYIAQNFYEKGKKAVTYRNCVHIFVCMPNTTDVTTNPSIASKTGHKCEYEAAEQLFQERKVPRYKYTVFRKDTTSIDQPKTLTNLWGEIKGLGKFPWAFM